MPGTALGRLDHDAPFDAFEASPRPGGFYTLRENLSGASTWCCRSPSCHSVDEVSETEGTWHWCTSPLAVGADDFRLSKEHQLPLVAPLNDAGYFCRWLWAG